MSEQPTVQPQSNVLGILSIVFAILGIFFLGIVFVPLAFLCAIAATYQAVKKQASLVIAILAWILYDRGAHDLARAASYNRHLRFVAANIRAAYSVIKILPDEH